MCDHKFSVYLYKSIIKNIFTFSSKKIFKILLKYLLCLLNGSENNGWSVKVVSDTKSSEEKLLFDKTNKFFKGSYKKKSSKMCLEVATYQDICQNKKR